MMNKLLLRNNESKWKNNILIKNRQISNGAMKIAKLISYEFFDLFNKMPHFVNMFKGFILINQNHKGPYLST